MNNTQLTIRVGFFFILGLALTWVTFETLSDGTVFKDRGYTIVAGFDDLKSLKKSDEVRMAGVRIGSVEATRLAGRRAEAVLHIDPNVVISGDSTATITMSGLLGSNYISVELGSPTAPPLRDGAEIATRVTPDLNSVMKDLGSLGAKLETALGSIGNLTGGADGQPSLFQKIDAMVTENRANVAKSLANLEEISGKISRGDGTLGKLVNNPQLHDELLAAIRDLKAGAAEARTFLANFQEISEQVKSGRGTLGALIYDDTTGQNLKATVANFRAMSDKIARGEGSLGQLINDDSLVRDARGTLLKAERALDGMEDAGPINAVGVVAKSLF